MKVSPTSHVIVTIDKPPLLLISWLQLRTLPMVYYHVFDINLAVIPDLSPGTSYPRISLVPWTHCPSDLWTCGRESVYSRTFRRCGNRGRCFENFERKNWKKTHWRARSKSTRALTRDRLSFLEGLTQPDNYTLDSKSAIVGFFVCLK